MASYETEHNIESSNDNNDTSNTTSSGRLDLSSFYSHLEYVNTASNSATAPPPRQSDVSAAYRMLANAYQVMQGERTGVYSEDDINTTPAGAELHPNTDRLQGMIDFLISSANEPPSRPNGVPPSFFDELERVSKQELQQLEQKSKEELTCPICFMRFLDDQRPLVVRLRCSKLHIFDLECLQPWLTLSSTCPLDRQNLIKDQKVGPPGASQDFRDLLLSRAGNEEQRRHFAQAGSKVFATEEMSEEVDDMYG